jgi:hypothetical protein
MVNKFYSLNIKLNYLLKQTFNVKYLNIN